MLKLKRMPSSLQKLLLVVDTNHKNMLKLSIILYVHMMTPLPFKMVHSYITTITISYNRAILNASLEVDLR